MGYVDSKQIEKKAILAVENYFVKSKVIQTYVTDNDKEPFWDGHLYIYSDEQKTKTNFIGRVAVQVKGKLQKKQIKRNEISYPIEMSALNAYSREGIMYFVVMQTENENIIYYRSLTPIVIRNVKRINKGKVKPNIRLNILPLNLKDMESELVEFFENCKKQVSYADSKVLNFEDLKKQKVNKLTFVAHGYDNTQHIVDFLSKKSVYVYAVMMDGVNSEIPIGEGPMFLTFAGEVKVPVTIKGKSYFDSYKSIVNKDSIIIQCGECLKLEIPKSSEIDRGKISFSNHSVMLYDAINENEFLLDMIKNLQIELGNQVFKLQTIKCFDKKRVEEDLVFLYKLKKLLQTLGCNIDMDISKLTNDDFSTIELLFNSICNNECVDLNENETCIMSLHLSNLVLQLAIFKEDSGLFKIYNLFDPILVFAKKYDDEMKAIPSFAILDKDIFTVCSNLPYHNIVPAYENLKKENSFIIEVANLNLLEMLHAIDRMEKDDKRYSDFKEAINDLSIWIYENETIEERRILHRINQLQIYKRERSLVVDEKMELKELLLSSTISDMEKCAIYILLDDDEMVDIYMNIISEDKINELKAYPIWNLRNKRIHSDK